MSLLARWRRPKGPRRPQPHRRGHARLTFPEAAELLGEGLARWFASQEREELRELRAGFVDLAERLAVKRACRALFLREHLSGSLGERDFRVRRDEDGTPTLELSPEADAARGLHWIAALRVELRRGPGDVTAVVVGSKRTVKAPWHAALLHALLPIRRRVVRENLRHVFGDVLEPREQRELARAYTLHFVRSFLEWLRVPWIAAARRPRVRVENLEAALAAHREDRGLLFLTGHFGNWEVASVEGLAQLPRYRGRIHVIRKRLNPRWLDRLVSRRMEAVGLGTLPRRDALDTVQELLARGDVVSFVYDQFARGNSGLRVPFLGQEAATLRSLAILSLAGGTPVVPVGSWREPDGGHVLRFGEPLEPVSCAEAGEAIWCNVRRYNRELERILLRQPEQWIWMHRRWKL